MTCLSASLLIVLATMNVQALDFAEFLECRFKIEFVYGCAKCVPSWLVYNFSRSFGESRERFCGVAITRIEQFPKASSCGRGFLRVEAPIRFTSSAMGGGVR